MPDDFHSLQASHAGAHQRTPAPRGSILTAGASTADVRGAANPVGTSAAFGAGALVGAGGAAGTGGGAGADVGVAAGAGAGLDAGLGAGGGGAAGAGAGVGAGAPAKDSRPRAAAVTSGQPNERATRVSICAERCSSRVSRSTRSVTKSSNGRIASWIHCTLWLWRSDAERERVSRRSLALAWHSTSGRNTGSSACATPSTRFSTSIAFCITAAISASFAPEGSAPDDCHRTSITR